MTDLDAVLGGGIVHGSILLLAGEPGIGKSTLTLQAIGGLGAAGHRTLLVSGEESLSQLSLRARRLGLALDDLRAAASSSLPAILDAARREQPDVLVVDSIQTMQDPRFDQGAGSVIQVRECAVALAGHARSTGTAVILVGHVTKEGTVAGPKTLEHLVDAVVNFEGDRTGSLRLLRTTKNRFGSCDEVGVFSMGACGLVPVDDPSAVMLEDRREGAPGSTVFPSVEGTRPILKEIQALVTASEFAQSRRVAIGVDQRRLALLIGIMTERAALSLDRKDVFAAAAGGLSVKEPAADLALCLAVGSACAERPLDPKVVAIGEVGLSGEIRRVPSVDRRLAEAARMGFTRALVPRGRHAARSDIDVVPVGDLAEALIVTTSPRSIAV